MRTRRLTRNESAHVGRDRAAFAVPGPEVRALEELAGELPPEVGEPIEAVEIQIAQLIRQEFAAAQLSIFDLRAFEDYDDWLDVLESRQMGLSMAGVRTRVVTVRLTPYLTWCRDTAQQPSASSLDRYAQTADRRR